MNDDNGTLTMTIRVRGPYSEGEEKVFSGEDLDQIVRSLLANEAFGALKSGRLDLFSYRDGKKMGLHLDDVLSEIAANTNSLVVSLEKQISYSFSVGNPEWSKLKDVLIIAPLIGKNRELIFQIFGLLRENGYRANTIDKIYNIGLIIGNLKHKAKQGLLQKLVLIDEGTKDPHIARCISRFTVLEFEDDDGPSISVEVVNITRNGKSLAARLIKTVIDSIES